MNTKYQLTISYTINNNLHMVHTDFWLTNENITATILHWIDSHSDVSIDSIEVNAM